MFEDALMYCDKQQHTVGLLMTYMFEDALMYCDKQQHTVGLLMT